MTEKQHRISQSPPRTCQDEINSWNQDQDSEKGYDSQKKHLLVDDWFSGE